MNEEIKIEIVVNKRITLGIKLEPKMELIDFLGELEFVRKMSKTIEMPMEVINSEEKQVEKTFEKVENSVIPQNIKDEITRLHNMKCSSRRIAAALQKRFKYEISRRMVKKLMHEDCKKGRFTLSTVQRTLLDTTEIPQEIKDKILAMRANNLSSRNIVIKLRNIHNYAISLEQVQNIRRN